LIYSNYKAAIDKNHARKKNYNNELIPYTLSDVFCNFNTGYHCLCKSSKPNDDDLD